MSSLNFSHQDNIFEPRRAQRLTVIGVGSIGSHVALAAAKMGVSDITVYDGDSVESHNIPMSVYRTEDLAKTKVVALESIIHAHTGTVIKAKPVWYRNQRPAGTVISCVDTMEARQDIFKQVKRNPMVDLFIDTRVASEFISIFAIEPCKPEDIEYYEYFLRYSTEEALRINCGNHGIVFISMRVASVVCANLTNFWLNGKKEMHYKELGVTLKRA